MRKIRKTKYDVSRKKQCIGHINCSIRKYLKTHVQSVRRGYQGRLQHLVEGISANVRASRYLSIYKKQAEEQLNPCVSIHQFLEIVRKEKLNGVKYGDRDRQGTRSPHPIQ
ncbi:hypothetical protein TNCV_2054011 [Trichonephila clavipes]|nr:hypothetical protein TNCV_2054011 [Trichonephila clavipes]